MAFVMMYGPKEEIRREVPGAPKEEAVKAAEAWIKAIGAHYQGEWLIRVQDDKPDDSSWLPLEEVTGAFVALERARRIDPGNRFVASCQSYFERFGDLTPKQIAALKKVTPTKRRGNRYERAYHAVNWGSDFYSHDEPGMSQSWDFAGGD